MLPVDAQVRVLQKVLQVRYGDRVKVAYQQHSTIQDPALRRAAFPLPAVSVNGAVILKGCIDLQAVTKRLDEMGVPARR